MPKSEKIALVTGANKGIGFEVARQLAAKGFREVIGTADRQCFKQRRTTARRRRWLVAGVLHFKNGVEWGNFAARRCTAEICREFSLSGLGPHRYGWGQCDSLGRTRCGRNCLARGRGTAKSHRQIFAGSQSDSVVTTLVPRRSNEH